MTKYLFVRDTCPDPRQVLSDDIARVLNKWYSEEEKVIINDGRKEYPVSKKYLEKIYKTLAGNYPEKVEHKEPEKIYKIIPVPWEKGEMQIQIHGKPYNISIGEFIRLHEEVIKDVLPKYFERTGILSDNYDSTKLSGAVERIFNEKPGSRDNTGQVRLNRLAENGYLVNDNNGLEVPGIMLMATPCPKGVERSYELIPATVEHGVLEDRIFQGGDLAVQVNPRGEIFIDGAKISLNIFEGLEGTVNELFFRDEECNKHPVSNNGSEVPVQEIRQILGDINEIRLPYQNGKFPLDGTVEMIRGEIANMDIIGIRNA